MDIIVDRTDKNAVVARDQAIIEAQRTAFQKLIEKWMPPETLKGYKLPDNKTISALVQDFEIKNEQISVNRYVASFTVRFSSDINNYVKIPADAGPIVASTAPAASAEISSIPVAATPTGPREVLVLPYFENAAGKKILWEDPNPWREAWQAAGNSTLEGGLTVTVPLGDLADISSGNTDAVWSGDYSAIEMLRTSYSAGEVALAVAVKSGSERQVDFYIYKDGKLDQKKPIIPPSLAWDEVDSLKPVVTKVIKAIQSPESFAEGTTEPKAPELSASMQSPPLPEKINIEATMTFGNFSQWLEVQKRLMAITPSPTVAISSLTKNAARFTIAYDGGLETFKTALTEKGIVLDQPVVEVNDAVPGSGKPTQTSVYELRLLN